MTMNELYRIGQQVDNLQMMNYQGTAFQKLLVSIDELEQWFEQYDNLPNDDTKIVFNYTRANYMAVLIEIARHHGGDVHNSIPYSQYKAPNDFLYDYDIQRMNLLREALNLYENLQNSRISNTWINQVRVNLANVYREVGRIVEALDILAPCKDVFGMARINYAAKIYELSFYTIDKNIQKELLTASLYYYNTVISQYPDRKEVDPIPEDIFEKICVDVKDIASELETEYHDIPNICDFPYELENSLELEPNRYKQWCRDNRLILSVRNLYQCASLSDDIHLPNMGIGYFAHDRTLSYYSWFNTLKQEYNQARYYLYLSQSEFQTDTTHESQENILLVNTLDYPSIGYRTELLKSSLKTAYGVLDKIGLLCNDFVCEKNMPAHKISFLNWFVGIEDKIQINDKFTSLYWVAKDLSQGGSFNVFRLLRNVIEHRYLRVVDNSTLSIEEELSNQDKLEYIISFSELQKQTYDIIKLIRALLFYVVFAFNSYYIETLNLCEKNSKIFIPLILDHYDDEWKN